MAFELQSQLENWRLRLHASGAGQFYRWWKSELVQLLPPHMQARMQHASRRVVMQVDGDELAVSSFEGGRLQMLDVFPLGQDAAVQGQQIHDLLKDRDLHEVPRDLLMSQESVLIKEIALPQAAEANLRQALTFELDRHTPFRANSVYFDYRIMTRDRESGQTFVELVVVPKEKVDNLVKVLAPRGMAPTGVDVLEGQEPSGLNLLPANLRFRMTNRRSRINLLMALTAVTLTAVVMAQSLWLREHQIEQVQEVIETVRVEARLVAGLRSQIEDATQGAGFMSKLRQASMPAVQVLAEVSRVLPDDTYLDRLRIAEGTIQLQGKSTNAQQLIEVVNQSDLFAGASFRGSTRFDSRSGREIFDLNSDLVQGGAP